MICIVLKPRTFMLFAYYSRLPIRRTLENSNLSLTEVVLESLLNQIISI